MIKMKLPFLKFSYLCKRMKSLTAILAIAFTLLAMKPGIDILHSALSADLTCNVECSEDSERSCEGRSCNPFQACNSCVLLCPTAFASGIELKEGPCDHGLSKRPSFISEYDSEFWQPPKIV